MKRCKPARGPGPEPAPEQQAQTPPQAPLNDNSYTFFSWASRQLRRASLEIRYGNTATMVAQGHREVSAAYDTLRERSREEGSRIALSPAFNNTLLRHAQVLRAAEPFRRDPDKFRDLLRDRGGLDASELEHFANQYDKAKRAQRQASNDVDHDPAIVTSIDAPATRADAPAQQDQATVQQTTRRTRALPSAAELSAGLAARAEDVCRQYLPHGKREGDQWTAAAIQPDSEQRIHVALDGANAGKWQDRSGSARGDLLDLIRHTKSYETIAEAMKEATGFLDLTPQTRTLTAPTTAPVDRAQAETARVQALYDRALRISADDPAGPLSHRTRHRPERDLGTPLSRERLLPRGRRSAPGARDPRTHHVDRRNAPRPRSTLPDSRRSGPPLRLPHRPHRDPAGYRRPDRLRRRHRPRHLPERPRRPRASRQPR